MKTTCNCKSPVLFMFDLGSRQTDRLFNNYYYSVHWLECFNCKWHSGNANRYDRKSPYTLLGKLLCKIVGHHEFELTVASDRKSIVHSCKRCGVVINNMNSYERLQKLKKLKR